MGVRTRLMPLGRVVGPGFGWSREVPAGPVLGAGRGPAEEVALDGCSAESGDRRQFVMGFDAFGDERCSELFREADHGLAKGMAEGVRVDSGDEVAPV